MLELFNEFVGSVLVVIMKFTMTVTAKANALLGFF